MSDNDNELRDPLGELSNEEFDALTPNEKGLRTKEANRRAEEGDASDPETPDAGAESAPAEPAVKVTWITAGPDGKKIA